MYDRSIRLVGFFHRALTSVKSVNKLRYLYISYLWFILFSIVRYSFCFICILLQKLVVMFGEITAERGNALTPLRLCITDSTDKK